MSKRRVPLVQSDFRDDGCELFHSCLSCPLPKCQYDEKLKGQFKKAWLSVIFTLTFKYGYSIGQIAAKLPGAYPHVIRPLVREEKDRRERGEPGLVDGYQLESFSSFRIPMYH